MSFICTRSAPGNAGRTDQKAGALAKRTQTAKQDLGKRGFLIADHLANLSQHLLLHCTPHSQTAAYEPGFQQQGPGRAHSPLGCVAIKKNSHVMAQAVVSRPARHVFRITVRAAD